MVTNKIVMEHGGEISFDSEEGVGSTFTIILPSPELREALDREHHKSDQEAETKKKGDEGVVPPKTNADLFG